MQLPQARAPPGAVIPDVWTELGCGAAPLPVHPLIKDRRGSPILHAAVLSRSAPILLERGLRFAPPRCRRRSKANRESVLGDTVNKQLYSSAPERSTLSYRAAMPHAPNFLCRG